MSFNPEVLLETVQEEFENMLTTKTSWGRNELLIAFERAKVKALLRFIKLENSK